MAPTSWHLFEDRELKVVHSSRGCPAASVALKYNYLEGIYVSTPEDLRALDQRAKACDRCIKRETTAAKRANYTPPPGFRGMS